MDVGAGDRDCDGVRSAADSRVCARYSVTPAPVPVAAKTADPSRSAFAMKQSTTSESNCVPFAAIRRRMASSIGSPARYERLETIASNASMTATLAQAAASSLTVVAFTGADTTGTSGSGAIGATKSASGTAAPSATLTTTLEGYDLEIRSGPTQWRYVIDPETLFFREDSYSENGQLVSVTHYRDFRPNTGLDDKVFEF